METILFINPPLSLTERYGAMASAGAENPPHAFLYLGVVTRQHGYNTKILDASAHNMTANDILDYIDNIKPDYIGMTAFTISIDKVASLTKIIKNKNPDIKIIIGGPHISAIPEETFTLYKDFDYALIGEAETSLIDLLKVFKEGGSLDDVPGLCYRSDGEIIVTAKKVNNYDLKNIGILAWDLLDGYPNIYSAAASYFSKTPYTDIITSRGCPFLCTFCDRAVFGNKVRSIGIDNIIQNIEFLVKKYGIKSLYFQDDTLLSLTETLDELCEYLIKRKYDLIWSCNSRINQITETKLEMLKKAGCWKLSIGIESGSEKILKIMNKKINMDQVTEKLKLARKCGIKTNGYFILGSFGETKETLRETIEFCKKVELDTIRVSYFTPFPGSELSKQCLNSGTIKSHWSKFSFYNVVYVPKDLSEDDLVRTYKKIMKNFYLRPKTIYSYLSTIKRPENLVNMGKGFYGLSKMLLSKK